MTPNAQVAPHIQDMTMNANTLARTAALAMPALPAELGVGAASGEGVVLVA